MYLIEKSVNGIKYWWNESESKWEGLMDNATPIKKSQIPFWDEKIKKVQFINCEIVLLKNKK